MTMKPLTTLISWIACMQLLSEPVYAKGIGSRCNATAAGGSGTITCYFKQDLNVRKLDFTVQRQRINSSSIKPVLSCFWESETDMRCVEEPGYTFNKTVSDLLQVNIPRATSDDHDGKYSCQLVTNPDSDLFLPCELNIAGIPDQPTDIYVSNSTLESVTICWKVPPDTGKRVLYRIRYKLATPNTQYDYVDTAPGVSCFTAVGLTPGRGYNISILARNKFGSSAYRYLGKIANTSELISRKSEICSRNNTLFALTIAFGVFSVITGVLLLWLTRSRIREGVFGLLFLTGKHDRQDTGIEEAPIESPYDAQVVRFSSLSRESKDDTSPWSTWSVHTTKLTSSRSERGALENGSISSRSVSSGDSGSRRTTRLLPPHRPLPAMFSGTHTPSPTETSPAACSSANDYAQRKPAVDHQTWPSRQSSSPFLPGHVRLTTISDRVEDQETIRDHYVLDI